MIKVRAERSIRPGEYCVMKESVKELINERPHGQKYKTHRFDNFTAFMVVNDSLLGKKGLSVIIPIKHTHDSSQYGFHNMQNWLRKGKAKRFIVFSKTLSRFEGDMEDIYPNKNESQLKAVCNYLNTYQLDEEIHKIEWESK